MSRQPERDEHERSYYHDFQAVRDTHFSDPETAEAFTRKMLKGIDPRQLRAFHSAMSSNYPGHENIILEGLLIFFAGTKRRVEINQLDLLIGRKVEQPIEESVRPDDTSAGLTFEPWLHSP